MAEQRQFSQTSLGQLQKARIKIWEKRSNRSKTYLRSNKKKKVGGNAKNQHFLQEILHAYFLSPDPTTNFKTKNLEFAQNCLKKTIRQFDKKKQNNQGRQDRFLVGKDAIVAVNSSADFHFHRRILFLKIQQRTKPWLPCLPRRPR